MIPSRWRPRTAPGVLELLRPAEDVAVVEDAEDGDTGEDGGV